MPLLSIREYAKTKGVSHTAVQKRVRNGRISLVDGKIDPAQADAQWEQNRDIRQQERGAHSRGKFGPAKTVDAPRARIDVDGVAGIGAKRLDIQTAQDAVKLKREKMLLDKLEGTLLPRAEVVAHLGEMVITAKTNLRGIGSKLAPDLAAETEAAKCQAMVDAEIDAALTEISRWQPA